MEISGYGQRAAGRLDATFAALADPTRRAILARLVRGEVSVTELAAPFEMSQPAISKHLKVLERAGLVARGRDAQRRPVRAQVGPLTEASAWLDGYRRTLEANFARLDTLLESLKTARGLAPRAPSQRGRPPGRPRRPRKDT
jgi:DNA-binding transcriptional ArsR family regulator